MTDQGLRARLGTAIASGLVGCYGLVNRTGLLRRPLARRLLVASYFAYKRLLEDSLVALLARHPGLAQGGHVFDVGANIGYTAVVFGRSVSPGFRVFAFEPEPSNFASLESSIARHHLTATCEPIHAAVGAAPGEAKLWLNTTHHADHRIVTAAFESAASGSGQVTVPLVSVDSFVAQRALDGPVCLIKIDVQGYELPVLEGCLATLERCGQCKVLIEYCPEVIAALGFDPPVVLDFLRARGFQLYPIAADGSLSLLAQGVPDTGLRGYVDLVASRQAL